MLWIVVCAFVVALIASVITSLGLFAGVQPSRTLSSGPTEAPFGPQPCSLTTPLFVCALNAPWVTAVKPPATPTFEEIRSRVEQEFKNERSAQLLTQKTQELSDRAKADHDLKKAAKELGATYKTSDLVLPDGQVPDIGSMTGPAAVAFTLKPGEISGPINSGDNGAVLTVMDRQAPTEQDFAAKKDQIRETLVQKKQNEAFALYLETLRQNLEKSGKIKINQAELQTLTRSRTEESE